ncbi:hypothetical protein GW17_00055243, partial [Ensete ventricosum]
SDGSRSYFERWHGGEVSRRRKPKATEGEGENVGSIVLKLEMRSPMAPVEFYRRGYSRLSLAVQRKAQAPMGR